MRLLISSSLRLGIPKHLNLEQVNLRNTKWLDKEFIFLDLNSNFSVELNSWFYYFDRHAYEKEFIEAIALDLIRITSVINNHNTAIDMLTYAIDESPLFQHDDKCSSSHHETLGLFKCKSLSPLDSRGLLMAEKERRSALRDASSCKNENLISIPTL